MEYYPARAWWFIGAYFVACAVIALLVYWLDSRRRRKAREE